MKDWVSKVEITNLILAKFCFLSIIFFTKQIKEALIKHLHKAKYPEAHEAKYLKINEATTINKNNAK